MSASWASRLGGTLVLSFVRRLLSVRGLPLLLGLLALCAPRAGTQEATGLDGALDVDRYVEVVLRAHPSVAQSTGLERSAAAERKAARVFPDPVFEYTRDRATPTEPGGARATETGYAVSQTIPWPGTYGAGRRAGDRAADVLRAGAEVLRSDLTVQARQTFARLAAARALRDVAREAEADARSLRDLMKHRALLGEAREADRIKATVEWLRQQRRRAAAEVEAEAREAMARALAVEALPRPLAIQPSVPEPLPALEREALAARLVERSPRLRAAGAEAERQRELLSVARRGRIPDLGVTLFKQKDIDKEATGFALGVTVPLWNAKRGEIARAEAASGLAGAEVGRLRIELVTEVQARLQELQVAGDQVSLLDREILPAAEQSVSLVRLSFEEGETSLLELLDAQRTQRDTEREAAEAHLAFLLALGEVQRLAGADFNPWR